MAIFRKIHVSFWKDSFVESLTPEQKYFYLYLLTNERTTQCGIYEITLRQVCYDTGYNEDTVKKLISFFTDEDKIIYSPNTQELAIRNWAKYNDSTSSTVKLCINKELLKVKNPELINYLDLSTPSGIIPNPNYRVTGAKRVEVFTRFKSKCAKCTSTHNLIIDYIIPRSEGGTTNIDNLRLLCRGCSMRRTIQDPTSHPTSLQRGSQRGGGYYL